MTDPKSQLAQLSSVTFPAYNSQMQMIKIDCDTLSSISPYFDKEDFLQRKSTEHKIQLSLLRIYCS